MSLFEDIRFASRVLLKRRWMTAAAVVALALGIAANSAVFTFVNAVILRGVPFPDPDRVVAMGTRDARNRQMGVSYYDFLDWREAAKSFSDISLMAQPTFNVSEPGTPPERYNGAYVSASTFQLIGTQAQVGRGFIAEDDLDGARPVAVLGYSIWQSRYAGDPNVIGKTIRINDLLATVVGVMPPGMQFPPNTDLWLPFGQATINRGQSRQMRNYQVIARLADGVTIPQAQSELATITARLARDYPKTNEGIVPTVVTYNERAVGNQIRLVFFSLMGAVGFVLLIACSNVANLLLARSAERAKEVGVRVSLGASRGRVIRQLLVESVMLSLLGGLAGLPLAYVGIRIFDSLTQNVGKPYWMEFSIDPIVLAFFFAICLITGVVFGLAPALHVSKTSLNEVLKEGGRSGSSGIRAHRWTSGLLVVQVALTLVLLAGAGFMMRSFFMLYRLDLGFETPRLLTMQVNLNDRRYPTSEDRNAFARRLTERLAGIGALEAVTTASNFPLGGGAGLELTIDGRTDPNARRPIVTMLSVGAKYFDTVGIRILRGRGFTDSDQTPGRGAVIVNQRFADMYFKGEDPVGRQISVTEEGQNGIDLRAQTVIGVSTIVRQRDIENIEPDPVVYVPYFTGPNMGRTVAVIVRTSGETAAAVPLIRQAVLELDADIPVFNVRTMDELLAQRRWQYRVFGGMFAVFAAIALLLAAVGLYAVMAYSVTQRTQEIGVRMVLGAPPGEVVWLFLRRAFVLVGIGLTIGMSGAFGVGRLLQSILVQSTGRDVPVLVSISLLMIVVAVTACVWPARRATRLNPVAALRYE
ncbi:MAG TPA: ABC transporter permease [Vicinamibacterales bacterium]|nr:ABC transporter permease [Vicinamibacterales bacterium]